MALESEAAAALDAAALAIEAAAALRTGLDTLATAAFGAGIARARLCMAARESCGDGTSSLKRAEVARRLAAVFGGGVLVAPGASEPDA